MYDRMVRLFGGAWFFVLAVASAVPSQAEATSHWIARGCIIVLYLLFAQMIWLRPKAKAQSQGVKPRFMAFVGTYTPWSISFFPQNDYIWADLVSPALVISGMILAIITLLHLRTAFSLAPQAHRVVRSGPYRWLRHPLYVAEEIAIIGVLLQHFSPITILIVTVHLSVQIRRMFYEEELLGRTFPEYHSFGPRWRLVPFVY